MGKGVAEKQSHVERVRELEWRWVADWDSEGERMDGRSCIHPARRSQRGEVIAKWRCGTDGARVYYGRIDTATGRPISVVCRGGVIGYCVACRKSLAMLG